MAMPFQLQPGQNKTQGYSSPVCLPNFTLKFVGLSVVAALILCFNWSLGSATLQIRNLSTRQVGLQY